EAIDDGERPQAGDTKVAPSDGDDAVGEESACAPAGPPASVAEAVARLHAIIPELAWEDGVVVAAHAMVDLDDEVETVTREAADGPAAPWREPEPSDDDVVDRVDPALARVVKASDAGGMIDEATWRRIVENARARQQSAGVAGGAVVMGLVGSMLLAGGGFELIRLVGETPTQAERAVWWSFTVVGATAVASAAFLIIRGLTQKAR
ncbi:MAG: hypothetical protein MI723_19120, partial [Caulobacterales bacterium]|nr:hypothetical protein [Caulobacterales bacterium]